MTLTNNRDNIRAMPRMKSDAQRGYVGAWMRRERLDREWTAERAVEALRDMTGTVVRVDYYRQLEAGTGNRVPGPELMGDLVRLYGSRPQPLPEPEPEAPALSPDTLAIVAAIDRLAEAVGSRRSDELAAVVSQAVLATLRSSGALGAR